jgi:hypothetical protein
VERAEFDAAGSAAGAGARAEFDAARRDAGQGALRLEGAAGAAQGGPGLLRSGQEALALSAPAGGLDRALSAGELRTRVLTSGRPLASATSGLRGEAAIGTIAPEIRQRAETFSGPIETYEWVRNAVRPELYHGFMKGPLQTLLETSGNDADTAGLLIALLRAKGIPARYVRGTGPAAARRW